jgi:hypothetical protein
MMKTKFKIMIALLVGVIAFTTQAQIDKEALSLSISKAEDANLQKLKAYLWKRKSDVYMGGQVKATVFTEFSFDATGKLQAKVVDATSDIKKKPGLRGKMQANAIGDKMDYVTKALEVSIQYAYMTKGELLDFFSKATVSKKEDGTLVATADNVYVQGDKLTVHVDPTTNLFKYKEFKSLVGKDPLSGQVNYESFSSGVSHVATTNMDMPAQKMMVKALNQDYSQRVN